MPMPAGGNMSDEPIYPSLYLEWEQPYNFPDEGTMTVKFKKRSENNRKSGDKTMQTVELDITEITDTKGSEKSEEKSGDVLDKEVKKVVAKKTKPVEEAEDEESY